MAAAAAAVTAYAAGPVSALAASPAGGGPQISAQVTRRDGITTDVVRALDAADVPVDQRDLRRPSLDDVFLTLTGSLAADPQPAPGPALAEVTGGAA